jgi:hypothetical protein
MCASNSDLELPDALSQTKRVSKVSPFHGAVVCKIFSSFGFEKNLLWSKFVTQEFSISAINKRQLAKHSKSERNKKTRYIDTK